MAMHRLIDHVLAHSAIRLDRATRAVDSLALRRLLARYDTTVYGAPVQTPLRANFGFPTYDAYDDGFDDLA